MDKVQEIVSHHVEGGLSLAKDISDQIDQEDLVQVMIDLLHHHLENIKSASRVTKLLDLPTEMLIEMLSHLTHPHDLENTAKTCSRLRDVCAAVSLKTTVLDSSLANLGAKDLAKCLDGESKVLTIKFKDEEVVSFPPRLKRAIERGAMPRLEKVILTGGILTSHPDHADDRFVTETIPLGVNCLVMRNCAFDACFSFGSSRFHDRYDEFEISLARPDGNSTFDLLREVSRRLALESHRLSTEEVSAFECLLSTSADVEEVIFRLTPETVRSMRTTSDDYWPEPVADIPTLARHARKAENRLLGRLSQMKRDIVGYRRCRLEDGTTRHTYVARER